MKKIFIVLILLLSSFVAITTTTQANAEGCDAVNPCGSWAIVDGTGLVTGVMVCQEFVCGQSGAWAGKMPNDTSCPGCSIVLQIPPHPETHQSQGGIYGGPDPQSPQAVHYDSQAQIFTMGTESFPAPVVTKIETFDDGTLLTTLTTTVKSKMLTFTVSDFVNGEMKFTPVIDDQTGAELYVYQYINTDPLSIPTVQTITFESRKTKEEIDLAVKQQELNLLLSWMNNFLIMLGNWVIPTP
jgi:hypothetical protein